MEPVTTMAIATAVGSGLAYVGQKVAEKVVVGTTADEITKRATQGRKRIKDDKALQNLV